MNAETIQRLVRLEVDLGDAGKEEEALQTFRLRLVAEDAELVRRVRDRLAERFTDAKEHGATLRELAEISGYSIETVRKWIEKANTQQKGSK